MSASVTEIAPELVIDLRELERRSDVSAVVADLAPSLIDVPAPRYVRWVKPVLDRAIAVVLLLAVLPVLLLIALAVRVKLGPNVFYTQQRIGHGGRPFGVYKFRTMLPDRRAARSGTWDGVDRRCTHKTVADPRHTEFGRFLRKWSLDELPQLLNVVKGEMSLVGPRPELVDVVARYEPWEHARHAVRPGLTGLWQTTARAQGPTHLFTKLDLEYIRSMSLATDLKILLATIPAALGAQKGD